MEEDAAAAELLPAECVVSVLMSRQAVSGHRWLRERWEVLAVVPGTGLGSGAPRALRQSADRTDLLWSGLGLRLYRDEAESYYYNLLSREPKIYVLLRPDPAGQPIPCKVTACFGEAHAYLETDDDVRAVAMSPELVRWLERFVLWHYLPEPRRKRRRDDWRELGSQQG